MNAETIVKTIWELLNTPVGITAIASAVLWGLNKLYTKKPVWQSFEGTIIAAVKWAEKSIDDKTENQDMSKLDAALRYVLNVYEKVEGKRASAAVTAELTEAIQVTHAELEATGNLDKAPSVEAVK